VVDNISTNKRQQVLEGKRDDYLLEGKHDKRISYISCLEELMSRCTNPFSCQGYIYMPGKLHQFGDEYYSVPCGLIRKMWAIKLVKSKDGPNGAKQYDDCGGKTVGLLL
jgi:hypothetical protein